MPFDDILTTLVKAFFRGRLYARFGLAIALISGVGALAALWLSNGKVISYDLSELLFPALSGIALLSAGSVYFFERFYEDQEREQKIEVAEQQFRENPEKPQLAWDVARIKLESYLDRNLSQVRSIYWLTLIVMVCGFSLVLYGLFEAFNDPNKFKVAIVSSASGVLVSFIGGSFLVIYRSVLAQSKDYVTVLERINAVGMAVQVIASIPERSAEKKDDTTAKLARQLLGLYAALPSTTRAATIRRRRSRRSKGSSP